MPEQILKKMMDEMFDAYRRQDPKKLEQLMVESDASMSGFCNIMFFHRNQNWVKKN